MADISWQDIKALSATLEKKRAEMQQMWREQGDREAYWRREIDGVHAQLAETRTALDERDTAIASLEGDLTALREQLAEAQAGGATAAEVQELHAALEATQAQLDDLLDTNTQLQTDLQTLHEEMAELRAQGGGAADEAVLAELQDQIAQLEAEKVQLMADLQLQGDQAGGLPAADELALSESLAEAQQHITLLEHRLTSMAEANPDALVVAELSDERDILQEELGAWLEMADSPQSLREYLTQLETDLETARRQVAEAQAGLAPAEAAGADPQALAESQEQITLLQEQLAILQADYDAERERWTADLQAQQEALAAQPAVDPEVQAELEALRAVQAEHEQLQQEVETTLRTVQADADLAQADLVAERERLAALDAELAQERERAASLETQLGDLRADHAAVSEQATQVGLLQAQVADLQADLERGQAEHTATLAQLTALEAELAQARADGAAMETLQPQLTAAEARISELETELDRVRADRDGVVASLDALRQEATSLSAQLEERQIADRDAGVFEAEMAQLREAYELATEQLASLRAEQVHAHEQLTELSRVEALMAAREQELQDLRQQVSTLEQAQSQLAGNDEALETIQAQLATVQSELAERDQAVQQAEAARAEAVRQAGDLAERQAQLQALIQELRTENDTLRQTATSASTLDAEVTARMADLQAQAMNLSVDLRQAQAQNEQLTGSLDALRDQQIRSQQEVVELRAQQAALQADLQAAGAPQVDPAELDALRAERDRLALDLLQVRAAELDRLALQTERDSLQTRLAESLTAVAQLGVVQRERDTLQTALTEAQAAAAQVGVLQAERDRLAQSLAAANTAATALAELQAERDRLAHALLQAEEQKAELTSLRGERDRLAAAVYEADTDAAELDALRGERDRLQAALTAAQQQGGQAASLQEAIRNLQTTQQQVTAERDTLAAEVASLRQQQAGDGQDLGYWKERAESFEAKYQELFWQKALADQETAAGGASSAEVAALQAEVERLRQLATQAQAEIDRLQAALADSRRRAPELDLQQVAMIEAGALDATNDGLSKAIAKQLGRVSRSLARLGISRTAGGETSLPANEQTLWVMASADRGRQWADELSQYLNEYGLNLIWVSDPNRLPQPWLGSGLVLFSDEPGADQWAMVAKERQIPLLLLEPTNLVRVKIAILDRFIRK
jgi:chromosome segregation ATPase